MLKKTTEKIKKTWAFALAAASLPLSYVFLLPCLGSGCASCPTGGACLLSAPLLIIIVLAGKSFAKTKKSFSRLLGQKDRANKSCEHQSDADHPSNTNRNN